MVKSVHNARRFVNPLTVLWLFVLGTTLSAGFFFAKLGDERDARLRIDATLVQARAALQSLRFEEATLTERAVELPSPALAPRLPSRAEAFRLGETFTAYIAEQRLALSAFATAHTGSTLGGKDAPAVSHTLEVGGSAATLIQMLDLARDVPSSIVRDLEFQREGGSHDQWVMSITVVVFYDEPEGQG